MIQYEHIRVLYLSISKKPFSNTHADEYVGYRYTLLVWLFIYIHTLCMSMMNVFMSIGKAQVNSYTNELRTIFLCTDSYNTFSAWSVKFIY